MWFTCSHGQSQIKCHILVTSVGEGEDQGQDPGQVKGQDQGQGKYEFQSYGHCQFD